MMTAPTTVTRMNCHTSSSPLGSPVHAGGRMSPSDPVAEGAVDPAEGDG